MEVTQIFNAEVNVINEQNDYVLEARVRVDNEQVQNITNGIVKLDDVTIASFNYYGENNLSFNVWDYSKISLIIPEILSFIDEIKNDEELFTILAIE